MIYDSHMLILAWKHMTIMRLWKTYDYHMIIMQLSYVNWNIWLSYDNHAIIIWCSIYMIMIWCKPYDSHVWHICLCMLCISRTRMIDHRSDHALYKFDMLRQIFFVPANRSNIPLVGMSSNSDIPFRPTAHQSSLYSLTQRGWQKAVTFIFDLHNIFRLVSIYSVFR